MSVFRNSGTGSPVGTYQTGFRRFQPRTATVGGNDERPGAETSVRGSTPLLYLSGTLLGTRSDDETLEVGIRSSSDLDTSDYVTIDTVVEGRRVVLLDGIHLFYGLSLSPPFPYRSRRVQG